METYLEQYVINGGAVMIALIPCSLLLVAAIVQAMIRLRPARVAPEYLLSKALRTENKNDRIAFAGAVKEEKSALGRALSLTLQQIDLRAGHQPHRRRLDALSAESAAFVADDLYDSLNLFSTLYTVAPLLGLLGTITGMISAFQHFGGQGAQDIKDLSGGIQEALITTLWGLAIAIPSYICAQVFYGRVRRYERERIPQLIQEIVRALFHGAPHEADGDDESGREPEAPTQTAPFRPVAIETREVAP